MDSLFQTKMSSIFNNTFTFKQLLENDLLQANLRKGDIPEVISPSGTDYFISNQPITIMEDGTLYRVCFLYFTSDKVLKTNMSEAYCQLPRNLSGYLLKVCAPAQNKTPHALRIDYLVDLLDISYTIDSTIEIKNNNIINEDEVIERNILRFKSLSVLDFSLINGNIESNPFRYNTITDMVIEAFESDISKEYIIKHFLK